MFSISNLTKIYPKSIKPIFQNRNFSFESGKMTAIVGQSGAGKTTLLKILGLIDTDHNAQIVINNQQIDLKGDILKFQRENIGFVFQDFLLVPEINAVQNVALPLMFDGTKPKIALKVAQNLLIQLGLEERLHYLPENLSGGQQQRVAIARALARNPHIILADEPTGNLDEINTLEVLKILKELANNGKTVIVVTHSKLVMENCDIILKL